MLKSICTGYRVSKPYTGSTCSTKYVCDRFYGSGRLPKGQVRPFSVGRRTPGVQTFPFNRVNRTFRSAQGYRSVTMLRKLQFNNSSANKAAHLTSKNIEKFIQQYDNILLDCDGVLWRTDHVTPISGVADAVNKLRARGKKLHFVTNNAMHARSAYLEKFKKMAGFEASLDTIFPVTYAAAVHAKEVLGLSRKVYAIGTPGLQEELELSGLTVLGVGRDTDVINDHPRELMKYKLDPEVDVVVVGYDSYFNYNKLFKAASYLRDPHCHYIATNDLECGVPLGEHYMQPITGSMVAAVSAASKRSPLVVGKPHSHLFKYLERAHGLDPKKTIMIGDSLRTDIPFAANSGIDSLLVLTGASKLEHISSPNVKHKPTYVLNSFSDFAHLL